MRQRILHTTDWAQVEGVMLLGAEWKVNVVNDSEENGGKGKLGIEVERKEAKVRFAFHGDKIRFERKVGGEPVEYLQRDLATGVVGWNSAKPYTASGREYVEVPLGLEMVL